MEIVCPLCQQLLSPQEKSWRCDNGHCFDIAKQGYTHLLPVQNKKTLSPGDNAEMVAARSRFLNAGYYQAFSDCINQNVLSFIQQQPPVTVNIVDAGCGEGYYTNRLKQSLDNGNVDHHIIGLDISKFAMRTAAKRNKAIRWFVANSNNMPVRDNCADIVISLFAPIISDEFYRCLKPGGLLITASTGDQHLIELREKLYDNVNESVYNPATSLSKHFTQSLQQHIQQTILLPDTQAIKDLLSMTPHYWRVSPERKKTLETLQQLDITLDIQLRGFIISGTLC